MFGGRFSSSTGLVGIDFGSRGVKMVQVREQAGKLLVIGASLLEIPLTPVACTGNQQHVNAAAAARKASPQPTKSSATPPTPNGDTDCDAPAQGDPTLLAGQIRAAFTAGGFTGRRCVVALARHDVCVQSIRVPKMPDHELHQSVAWEASQRFGFDRNAMEVDFMRTGATLATASAGENREEIILIAAPHAAINARLEPVLAAGLRPVAVDTGFAALVRTFSRQTRRESDRSIVRAVVEVGYSGSTVLILRGDQVAFCKPIAIGGQEFNRAVADHLQMEEKAAGELRAARIAAQIGKAAMPGSITDPATDRAVYEAVRPLMGDLVKEVTLCLRYYGVTFRGHPPDRIILTGGDGMEPKLAEMMSHTCKTPVLFDDAAETLGGLIGQIQTSLNRTSGPAACWAAAVGLSLRGIGSRRVRNAVEQPAGRRGAA